VESILFEVTLLGLAVLNVDEVEAAPTHKLFDGIRCPNTTDMESPLDLLIISQPLKGPENVSLMCSGARNVSLNVAFGQLSNARKLKVEE